MKDIVAEGEELMPHRIQYSDMVDLPAKTSGDNSQQAAAVTPIRKISRNRGRVLQEEVVVE
ncbi:non-structural maintenance of chromosomes element-like protein, partial [Trifolium pratense]